MALYAITAFLGAFLLFQVQMMLAKYLLPWFGGAASVWTACMLFFQVLLLCGYAYSHVMAGPRRAGRRAGLHTVLLVLSVCLLAAQWRVWRAPLLPGPGLKPGAGSEPVLRILLALAAGVGLPYFVLSTTSSLMQAWFARSFPGRSPYGLYALSNGGSLLGVLSYPFVAEPLLGLKAQAAAWALCYAVFAACGAACALRVRAAPPQGTGAADSSAATEGRRESLSRPLWWIALSACGCVLFLATTARITEEIAAIPFLWAIPLGLYLLSFILCFSGGRWYSRGVFIALWLLAVALMQWTIDASSIGVFRRLGIYWFAQFIGCMICHGELAATRPEPARLTLFYVHVAAGGALGGLAVLLLAPAVFDGIWELYVGYFGAALALAVAFAREPRARVNRFWRPGGFTVMAVAAALLIARCVLESATNRLDVVAARRNFYGVLRVIDAGSLRRLVHAATMHGSQYRDYARRRLTTTYYTEDSGVGLAILRHRRQAGRGLNVGAVGLGAGTIAAYGRPGDSYRFYEINPANIDLATGPGAYFSFLADSKAGTGVRLGDARLLLEEEPPQDFDVLVLDAFSGGSTPMHLLTLEAFSAYLRHLRPDGVLAIHVTNKYLDLTPVVWESARLLGLSCVDVYSRAVETRANSADWMLLSRDASAVDELAGASRHATRSASRAVSPGRAWTDDRSSVLGLIRFRDRDAEMSRARGAH